MKKILLSLIFLGFSQPVAAEASSTASKIALGSLGGIGAGLLGGHIGALLGNKIDPNPKYTVYLTDPVQKIRATGNYGNTGIAIGYSLCGGLASYYCGGIPGLISWGISTSGLLVALNKLR